jgi:hypothetical protein
MFYTLLYNADWATISTPVCIYLNKFEIDENSIERMAAAPRIYVKIINVPTIFKVLGTLSGPVYCIRFNTSSDASRLEMKISTAPMTTTMPSLLAL